MGYAAGRSGTLARARSYLLPLTLFEPLCALLRLFIVDCLDNLYLLLRRNVDGSHVYPPVKSRLQVVNPLRLPGEFVSIDPFDLL
jgi:hypothetical protein